MSAGESRDESARGSHVTRVTGEGVCQVQLLPARLDEKESDKRYECDRHDQAPRANAHTYPEKDHRCVHRMSNELVRPSSDKIGCSVRQGRRCEAASKMERSPEAKADGCSHEDHADGPHRCRWNPRVVPRVEHHHREQRELDGNEEPCNGGVTFGVCQCQ